MSSWKANSSRLSATMSRVAVMTLRSGCGAVPERRGCPAIPTYIIGIPGRTVNGPRSRRHVSSTVIRAPCRHGADGHGRGDRERLSRYTGRAARASTSARDPRTRALPARAGTALVLAGCRARPARHDGAGRTEPARRTGPRLRSCRCGGRGRPDGAGARGRPVPDVRSPSALRPHAADRPIAPPGRARAGDRAGIAEPRLGAAEAGDPLEGDVEPICRRGKDSELDVIHAL